jgi:Fe-S-cluster-containing hydrogenase component 2
VKLTGRHLRTEKQVEESRGTSAEDSARTSATEHEENVVPTWDVCDERYDAIVISIDDEAIRLRDLAEKSELPKENNQQCARKID